MKKVKQIVLESAKDRLIEAAIKIFALHGYEGASTRLLAKEAGVNISASMYYFTDKNGLYKESMKHLANMMQVGIANKAASIQTMLSNPKLSEAACLQMLHEFMRGSMSFMLSDKVSPYAIRILMREQAEPSPEFEVFHEVMKPVQHTLIKLLARLTGLKEDSEELTLCVHSVLGQMTIFRTHREIILRKTGWKRFDDKAIEKIANIVLPQTDAIIAYYHKQTRRQS